MELYVGYLMQIIGVVIFFASCVRLGPVGGAGMIIGLVIFCSSIIPLHLSIKKDDIKHLENN